MGRMTGVRIFVYEELEKVPEGQVVTVPQLADLAEVPGARNAVRRILRDSESLDYSYWRVVEDNGNLLEETAGGGRDHQEQKLSKEGVEVTDGQVDLDTVQYRT